MNNKYVYITKIKRLSLFANFDVKTFATFDDDKQMTEETEIVVVSPQYVADIAVIMSTTGNKQRNKSLSFFKLSDLLDIKTDFA